MFRCKLRVGVAPGVNFNPRMEEPWTDSATWNDLGAVSFGAWSGGTPVGIHPTALVQGQILFHLDILLTRTGRGDRIAPVTSTRWTGYVTRPESFDVYRWLDLKRLAGGGHMLFVPTRNYAVMQMVGKTACPPYISKYAYALI